MIKFNALIDRPDLKEQYDSLQQNDKISFKGYWNDDLVYIGRIEVNRFGERFFCAEHNYHSDPLILDAMRYYNRLVDFSEITYFEKL